MTPLFEEKETSKTRTTKEKKQKLKNPKFAFFGSHKKKERRRGPTSC